MTVEIVPSDQTGGFDLGQRPRQREAQADNAGVSTRKAKVDRDPALAQAGNEGMFTFSILESRETGV